MLRRVDQGAIYTARLAGSAGPDEVLQMIVREHEDVGGLPLAFVLDGYALVRGHLAPPAAATENFDERHEAALRRVVETAATEEDRQRLEGHLAGWQEHGRWSARHRQSEQKEEAIGKALGDAQGEGELDPVKLPAEAVAPWIQAIGRPTCTLRKAVVNGRGRQRSPRSRP